MLKGIASVAPAGFTDTKIDTVALNGVNDDELVDLIEFGRTVPAEVRFIEYMDVGGATTWSPELVLSRAEMLSRLSAHYGPITPLRNHDGAPADRFELPDGTTFGIVSSTTKPFCATCDRSRLTADGLWYLCLYAMEGVNLRDPLREGASNGRAGRDDHRRVARPHRPRRGGPARRARPDAVHPADRVEARPAPGDAHPGRLTQLGGRGAASRCARAHSSARTAASSNHGSLASA